MSQFALAIPAGVLSAAGIGPAMSAIGSAFAPDLYVIRNSAWYINPRKLPDVGSVLAGINSGRVSGGSELLRNSGIFWAPTNAATDALAEDVLAAWPEERRPLLRSKLRQLRNWWDEVIKQQRTLPGIGQAIDLFTRGFIDLLPRVDGTLGFVDFVKRAGGDVDAWTSITNTMYTQLNIGELYAARNRGIIDNDAELRDGLARLGHRLPANRTLLEKLREQLPSRSDVMASAIRGLYSRGIESRTQLFAEMPAELQQLFNKIGMFGSSDVITGNGIAGPRATWAEVSWAASRTPLSIGEAREAFFRQRAERVQLLPAEAGLPEAFTADRLRDTILAHGYTARDRETLQALSFQPFPIRYLRTVVTIHAQLQSSTEIRQFIPERLLPAIDRADKQWAIDNFRDHGIKPDDAATMVDSAAVAIAIKAAQPQLALLREQRKKGVDNTLEGFRLGIVPTDDALLALVSFGLPDEAANEAINIARAEVHLATIKTAITGIKHDYLSGVLDATGTLAALVQAGVLPGATDYYLTVWTVERNHASRTATASQILKWVEEGLMDMVTARLRLQNLGFSLPETLLFLREAQHSLDKLAGQQLAAADRSRHQAALQLSAVARKAAQQHKAAIAALRSVLPKSVLLAGLKKGILSPQYVATHLAEQQYSQDEINLLIRETYAKAPSPVEKTGQATESPPGPIATQSASSGLGGEQGNAITPEHSASAAIDPATAGSVS